MNTRQLATAVRDKSDEVRASADAGMVDMDTVELIRVLARIIEGKSVGEAFGAPGDWGYNTPIGAALAAAPHGGPRK